VTLSHGSGADLQLSPEAWLQREIAAGRLAADPSSAVVALAVDAVRAAAGRRGGAVIPPTARPDEELRHGRRAR
jgi:hypothetical protein